MNTITAFLSPLSDVILAVIGLLGFEGIRVYKRLVRGLPPVPEKSMKYYLPVICVLALFSGALGYALANRNPMTAIVIGFAVPTGLKTILDRGNSENNIHVDDVQIVIPNTSRPIKGFCAWVRDFFTF